MCRIICVASVQVKPSRRTTKPACPFGEGIFTRRQRFEPTAAEQQWAAETSPYRNMDYDVIGPADCVLDQAAGAALATARLTAGILF